MSCSLCGIELGGVSHLRCSVSFQAAQHDVSWPYFPQQPGGNCKLCGEGPLQHRGMRTCVAGGLYCNAHDKKVPLCCNCGKDLGVSFFFAKSCPDCRERRQLAAKMQLNEGLIPARHLVILCHGLYGLPSELYAARDKLRDVPGCAVYCCESYAGSGTMRGIDEIGELIAQEVRAVIAACFRDSTRHALSTISFMGHSLGGIIARSAVSKLWRAEDGTIAGLKACAFISTASPHVGITNYGPLPQLPIALTAPLASIFAGKTGKDLFSIDTPNGEIRRLATDASALAALGAFKSRRMYALKSGDMLVSFERSTFQTPDSFLRRKHRTYTSTSTSTSTPRSSSRSTSPATSTARARTHTVTFHQSLPEEKSTGDLVVPWAAGLETLGWDKIMVEFDCGIPPNGHRKLVANHKDGLRDDREGNLVMEDLAAFVAHAIADELHYCSPAKEAGGRVDGVHLVGEG